MLSEQLWKVNWKPQVASFNYKRLRTDAENWLKQMNRKIRIGINGFGRIGRTILRIWSSNPGPFEVVFINDLVDLETCAYLFKYDSVFGPFSGEVATDSLDLIVNGFRIPFHQTSNISTLDLSDVDVVLECTGSAKTRDVAESGLRAGASKILISGPSPDADVTIILGANDTTLDKQRIVSNGSCTTNALAPILRLLDDNLGIIGGHMTTVHCYTGGQPAVDKPGTSLARSRAAALSMIPTSTSAAELIGEVLPHLADSIEARSIRVPTASVSAIDLSLRLRHDISRDEINALLKERATGHILGWTEEQLVSSDLRMRTESLIIAGPETSVAKGGLLRLFGWYDNEWAFSQRMLDLTLKMQPC